MRATSFNQGFNGEENKKKETEVSRRNFLGTLGKILVSDKVVSSSLVAGSVILPTELLFINKEELFDIFDNARTYGMEEDFLQLFEGISTKKELIQKKYGVEVAFRNLYKFFSHQEDIAKDIEKGGSVMSANLYKSAQKIKIATLEKALNDLETILEVWPASMVRSVKKVTFRGIEEKYDFLGHVDNVKLDDVLVLNQGREINISVHGYNEVSKIFSHEMCHLSEKYFLNDITGLDEVWNQSMKILGIEPNYFGWKFLNKDKVFDNTKVSKDEVLRAGYVRPYSASWPAEDRATTLEDMFDPADSSLTGLSRLPEWEYVKNEYLSKVSKKKALIQAFMYIFSGGKMDDVFFYTVDNPIHSPAQNFASVIADKRYAKQSTENAYETYKHTCHKLLCTTLGVQELPEAFLKFLAKVFSDKLGKGDWERYNKM